WDWMLVGRGLTALARAEKLSDGLGAYGLQAAIAACHARARFARDTDWERITWLYGELAAIADSPVVELNRAVAVSMASGPGAGLELVDRLVDAGTLDDYHLLPSVRGDFLTRLGRHDEARVEFERAAAMTQNERQRALVEGRAAEAGGQENSRSL
ncbi:MAG: RNA polymerase subunit sigma-24, partial [Thermoleophilaceae bacterium]